MKLHRLIIEYVEFKQSLGMRFRQESFMLKAFCKSAGDLNIKDVQSDSVIAYLSGKGPLTSSWHKKYDALKGFYLYAIGRSYVDFSPLPTTIPKRVRTYAAYIYTPEELKKLLKAADILEKSKCHVDKETFRTLLLLLFNTGLRIGEALSLTLADVSIHKNLLTIRDSKFFKSRLVPINPRLGIILHNYAKMKHVIAKSGNEQSAFFVKRNGFGLTHSCIQRTFRKLCNYCGISREDGARCQPRLHDIRHSYAISRLLDWYQKKADVQRLLPYLSTYLGHINISSTQHYLKMTPEILREASCLFEKYALSEANYV